jgi:arylsulfatase A-like enzyme
MYGYVMNENGRLVRFDGRPRDYETDVIARDSERFVQRASERDRPFFLSVDTLAPHQETRLEGTGAPRNPRPAPRDSGTFAHRPLPHPPSFDERDVSDKPGFVRGRPPISRTERGYLRTLYRSRLESLLAVDDLVGGLVATLRRTGELRRTLIVFTSDNGFMLGEHGGVIGKDLPYPASTGIPLIMRWPGHFRAGRTTDKLVANIDVAATLLDAAGVRHRTDGHSLLERGRRDALFTESRGSYNEDDAPLLPAFRSVTTPTYRYAEYYKNNTFDLVFREYYDLTVDPWELDNRADFLTDEQIAALSQDLERYGTCKRAECP